MEKLTNEQFIEKALIKYLDNEYGFQQTKYINSRAKVEIFCNTHKKYFQQTARMFLAGHGCQECGRNAAKIHKLRLTYGNNYDFSTNTCRDCLVLLDQSNWSNARNQMICKTCHNKSKQKWVAQNRESRKKTSALYAKNHPDARKETLKKYYIKTMEENPEILRNSSRRWSKTERGRAIRAAKQSRREALVKSSTPKWADLDKIKSFFFEAAHVTRETGVKHHVDHIIPLVENNLQVITAVENSRKKNKFNPE